MSSYRSYVSCAVFCNSVFVNDLSNYWVVGKSKRKELGWMKRVKNQENEEVLWENWGNKRSAREDLGQNKKFMWEIINWEMRVLNCYSQ